MEAIPNKRRPRREAERGTAPPDAQCAHPYHDYPAVRKHGHHPAAERGGILVFPEKFHPGNRHQPHRCAASDLRAGPPVQGQCLHLVGSVLYRFPVPPVRAGTGRRKRGRVSHLHGSGNPPAAGVLQPGKSGILHRLSVSGWNRVLLAAGASGLRLHESPDQDLVQGYLLRRRRHCGCGQLPGQSAGHQFLFRSPHHHRG